MPFWSDDKTELKFRWDSRQHHVEYNSSYHGSHDVLMLYGSQIGVNIDSSGKKHGGTLTVQFLDPNSIPVTYSLWLETWTQELRETLAVLDKALDVKPMERLDLRPDNFGISLSMTQSGREADVCYNLFCIPNDRRGKSTNNCCLRYELQPFAGADEWQLVQVAGGKRKSRR